MTILGQHTVAETRDLIRSLQFRINKIDQQWQKVRSQRMNPPSPEQQRTDDDWLSFLRVWTDTRDKQTIAMTAGIVASPAVHPSVLPAEQSWKAIDDVTRVRIPHLKDIDQRIAAEAMALSLPPIDLSQQPGQNAPDADFAALTKLDAAIAATGNPLGKPGGTDSIAKSPLGLIVIGGAIIAVIGGGLYVKTVMRL